MNLSKNFTLEEMIKSQTAERKGINNTPTPRVTSNLMVLARNGMQPIRDKFGIIVVTSGYRSPLLNTLVGGSKNSDHLLGYACDFYPVEASKEDVIRWVMKNLKFHQLISEYGGSFYNPSWIHLSLNPRMSQQVLRIDDTGVRFHV